MPLSPATRKGLVALVPGALALVTACGGGDGGGVVEPEPAVPLGVVADPLGGEFQGSMTVELRSSRLARIFYTLDGSPPSGPGARTYVEPIKLTESTLLSFIAVSESDQIWSPPGNQLYQAMPTPDPNRRVVERVLGLSEDSLFFAAPPNSPEKLWKTVRIRSMGTHPVQLRSIRIGVNPRGGSFWENGVFELQPLATPLPALEPGKFVELEIGYAPTATLSSAAVFVESDQDRSDGPLVLELWGRVINW